MRQGCNRIQDMKSKINSLYFIFITDKIVLGWKLCVQYLRRVKVSMLCHHQRRWRWKEWNKVCRSGSSPRSFIHHSSSLPTVSTVRAGLTARCNNQSFQGRWWRLVEMKSEICNYVSLPKCRRTCLLLLSSTASMFSLKRCRGGCYCDGISNAPLHRCLLASPSLAA